MLPCGAGSNQDRGYVTSFLSSVATAAVALLAALWEKDWKTRALQSISALYFHEILSVQGFRK